MMPATLETFEATLARHDSATKALEEWCAVRGIATTPDVRAEKVTVPEDVPPPDLAERLKIDPHEPISLRTVRLNCGATTLSIAWNWFVPSRMAPGMADVLHSTDTPFGKVASPLSFRRIALKTMPGQVLPCPAGTIMTHRALLVLPDERPLAYVLECYTEANLTAGTASAAP